MQRHRFEHNGLVLSYLDSGGSGPPLIALHAHWMEAATFKPLARALAPPWRVIALDQRGHGYSDHAASYTRDDYVGDLEALYQHLNLQEPVILLGNSLGGVNAYHFAARHPHLVRAMIIEDIGVELSVDVSFSLAWEGTYPTRDALAERIGPRLLPALQDSFRQTQDGWRLAWDPREMLMSNANTMGDHWQTWLATDCPALLIRGKDSRVTTQEHLEQMASRRPCTSLHTFEGGHVVHLDNPTAFNQAVMLFLQALPPVMVQEIPIYHRLED